MCKAGTANTTDPRRHRPVSRVRRNGGVGDGMPRSRGLGMPSLVLRRQDLHDLVPNGGDGAVVIGEYDHDVAEVGVDVDGCGYALGAAAVADEPHAVDRAIGEAVGDFGGTIGHGNLAV